MRPVVSTGFRAIVMWPSWGKSLILSIHEIANTIQIVYEEHLRNLFSSAFGVYSLIRIEVDEQVAAHVA